ncbi:MAG: hypothetical protein LBS62_12840 [Clostridiales bacterium]|nr:hypothetical protein [Clostridiales bacterium]
MAKAKRPKPHLILTAITVAVLTLPPAVNVSAALTMRETPYATYNVDKWGNAVPSPNGYLPVRAVTGFSDPQDLFYDADTAEIFLADSGGGGIIVLDENCVIKRVVEFTLDGQPYNLQAPTGIYAAPDALYVCDRQGGAVIKAGRDGAIQAIYGEPESELISDPGNYRPSKIVVDSYGKMYVQAYGVFQGIYCLTSEGGFINFYGANRVEMTVGRLITQLWKRLLTKEQRRAMQSFVPIEYSNLYIDRENFIYATVTATTDDSSSFTDTAQDIYRANSKELVRKLNPLGVNVMNRTEMSWFQNAAFTDITVNPDGVMTMCDSILGVIYQCDKNGKLMFAFGGLGPQLGLFSQPSALAQVGDELWVLDSGKRSITIFQLTEFGRSVHEAMRLYNQGRYQEDIQPWEQVVKSDANYLLAYVGLGKAYYQLEDYEKSMYYFKLAGDRAGYSDAFSEQSLIFMRANFAWFFFGAIFLAVGLPLIGRVVRGVKKDDT